MTYLTDLEQLIACAPLPSLRGYSTGSVRAVILDACDSGKIGAAEALELSRKCDRRIDAEGPQFGRPRQPEPAAPAPEPPRPPLPPPVILTEEALHRCSRARWLPDEMPRQGETAWEQESRLENYRIAIAIAREDGRELGLDRQKDAIWAAVAAEVASVARRKGAA